VPSLIGLLYLGDQVRTGFAAAAVLGFALAVAGAIGAALLRLRCSTLGGFGHRGRIPGADPNRGESPTKRHVCARLITVCFFRKTFGVGVGTVVEAGGVVSDRVRKFRRPAAEPVSFSPEV